MEAMTRVIASRGLRALPRGGSGNGDQNSTVLRRRDKPGRGAKEALSLPPSKAQCRLDCKMSCSCSRACGEC
eukprot:scaffold2664_cov117-Isochrysis_galbana.AAC.5